MWFKNLALYRLPAPWAMDVEKLQALLEARPFRPCSGGEALSTGWASPAGDDRLVHVVNQQWLLRLVAEQKILPASYVRQVAAERAEQIEAEQGFPLGKKRLKELREQVADELLPRAFPRRRSTWVWLDPRAGWLVVDAGSTARADEVLEALSKTIGDFPARRLATQVSPVAAMTECLLAEEPPPGWTVDQDTELKRSDDSKATVRYVRHPLDLPEIREHIESGKTPTRIALTWNERLSLVLTERLEIKRLNFLEGVKPESEGMSDAETFDADFALMAGELAQFLPDLLDLLGGEATPQ